MADAAEGMHGFPVALTSFVGRAQPVAEISDRLNQCRLVTVTGPGGAGKTRLAGEVAGRVASRFADGVWLAELAAVQDPAQVTAVVAAALGIRELPVVAPADALADALTRRQLLLVLDNCEQVTGAAAELCGRLLLGADDVRVLATSREPLRIAGEARYRLEPLTLPDPDSPPAAPEAGDIAAAEEACTAGLASSREVGDLTSLAGQLWNRVILDLKAHRTGDAAAHLREELEIATQTAVRPMVLAGLDCCGQLCVATRRPAEAVTVWAAMSALGAFASLPFPRLNVDHRDELLRKARGLAGGLAESVSTLSARPYA